MEEKDPKGFTVKDRRKVSLDDMDREQTAKESEPRQQETPRQQAEDAGAKFAETSQECGRTSSIPLPEVVFSTFILSLSSSALLHLGEIPDPSSQATEIDLPMAKHIIDTIGMLQEKTKGNLDPEEERLVNTLLYDLRLRYVQKCNK
ncbi:MAG: DUF1844 domain-containing protein [Desulforhabdus sp.]|jgi:hypothetical protein|nr:DUF1844 domain-containing protein [Desulforhabdus sp.]